MPFSVNMPDGTVVNNVPDGTTKEQFMAKYEANVGTAKPQTPAAAPQQPTMAPAQTPMQPSMQQPPTATPAMPVAPQQASAEPEAGFMERVGQHVQERRDIGQNLQQFEGQQTPFESGLQQIGKVGAGLVSDFGGEVAKSTGKTIKEYLPQDIKDIPTEWMKQNPKMTEQLGKAEMFGLSMLQKGANTYAKWAEQNPRFARNLESVVDIGAALPTAGAALKTAKAAGEISALTPIAKGLVSPTKGSMEKTTKNLYAASQKTAGDIVKGNVVLHPDVGTSLSKALDSTVKGVSGEQADRVKDVINTIDRFKDQISSGDTSLKNIFFQRKTLGDLAAQGGDTGAIARKARDEFDKVLSDKDLAKKVVGGDPKMAGSIDKFNKEYRQYKSHETIVDAITAPEGKPELSSNQIRTKMSKIAASDNFSYLTPEVQKLVIKAAEGKTVGNILGATNHIKNLFRGYGGAATLATGIGAVAAGNIPAALIATGVLTGSAASRQIAKGTVGDILNAIKSGK